MKKVVSCIVALMLIMFAAVPAFAASDDVKSPEGTFRYKITIGQSVGGSGSYEITKDMSSDGVLGIKLSATADAGYKFDHWVIDGAYKTDGSLNDATLALDITSDITATPYFVKADGTTEPAQAGTTVAVQKDTGSSSPKTGRNDAPLYAIILFAVVACGVATFKFVKSK